MRITEIGTYQFTEAWRMIDGEGSIPKGVIFEVTEVHKNGKILSPAFKYALIFDMPIKKLR